MQIFVRVVTPSTPSPLAEATPRGLTRLPRTNLATAPFAPLQMRSSVSARLRSAVALAPRVRCNKFDVGKVPGGGYQPQKSGREISRFFYSPLTIEIGNASC